MRWENSSLSFFLGDVSRMAWRFATAGKGGFYALIHNPRCCIFLDW
jgi:hypothetical protein